MKIQSLGILFILIVLPLTIVLAEYAHTQFDTMVLEGKFDQALTTATYDSLKAFQINTFNDPYSAIANRKISSIEAASNAFYNSIRASMRMAGYVLEDIQVHTPALVYTMYDGYYIYSPYADIVEINDADSNPNTQNEVNINLNSNNIEYGLKPYVYYSCRYVVGSDSNFVITYSLDNYISIVGTINGTYVNDAGYLISPDTLTYDSINDKYFYDEIEITGEGTLTENVVEEIINAEGTVSAHTVTYPYIKINGTKYYLNESAGEIFYISSGTRKTQVSRNNNEEQYNKYKDAINNNKSGITYFRDAYEFTRRVLNPPGYSSPYGNVLRNLMSSSAVDKDGNAIDWSTTPYRIFADSSTDIATTTPIEYSNSNFNEQRKAVIRYSIESNLSVAIANFNRYASTVNNDFQMPKLKDTDWELLQNQVSIISFLQGINIGGKVYNGYSVVTNDKTEEVVTEEDIYIIANANNYYHKVNDEHFVDGSIADGNITLGILDTDFQIRKDVATQHYYVLKEQYGCYTSIVSQDNVNNTYNSIYEYLADLDKTDHYNLKQKYYTALGRERWGIYKVSSKESITINDLVD